MSHVPSRVAVSTTAVAGDDDTAAGDGEAAEAERGGVVRRSEVVRQRRARQRRRRHEQRRQQELDSLPVDKSIINGYKRKAGKLWFRYANGIKMALSSWYEVTPEPIARQIASRFASALAPLGRRRSVPPLVVDCFSGVGSNAIQFARHGAYVIGVERDAAKARMARHNACVYRVAHRCDFIVGDAFEVLPQLRGRRRDHHDAGDAGGSGSGNGDTAVDAVFMSPPWGGPSYRDEAVFDVERHMEPYRGSALFQLGWRATDNVAVLLPRTCDAAQLAAVTGTRDIEVQENWMHGRHVTSTVYTGALIERDAE